LGNGMAPKEIRQSRSGAITMIVSP